jgi:hypothetical protein
MANGCRIWWPPAHTRYSTRGGDACREDQGTGFWHSPLRRADGVNGSGGGRRLVGGWLSARLRGDRRGERRPGRLRDHEPCGHASDQPVHGLTCSGSPTRRIGDPMGVGSGAGHCRCARDGLERQFRNDSVGPATGCRAVRVRPSSRDCHRRDDAASQGEAQSARPPPPASSPLPRNHTTVDDLHPNRRPGSERWPVRPQADAAAPLSSGAAAVCNASPFVLLAAYSEARPTTRRMREGALSYCLLGPRRMASRERIDLRQRAPSGR